MEEAHIVVDLEASPSESMQPKLNRGKKKIKEKHFTIKKKTQKVVDLEVSLQREVDTLWGKANEAENFTIFRTPHNISQRKKNLFQPSVISIGPFHLGKKHLRALKEQKMRFLRDFLSRGDRISLDLCISEMKLLETRTRRCYSETFDDLDSNTFVEMMLLDGCFVLEYFLKRSEDNWDSIHEVGWNSQFIIHDLLLQENQIPFFIVEKLCELIGFNQQHRMLFVKDLGWDLMARVYKLPAPPAETPDTIDSIIADPPAEIPDSTDSTDSIDTPAKIHHLVHLCYHNLVPIPGIPVILSSKPFYLTRMFKGLLHRFRSWMVCRRRSVRRRRSTGNLSSMVIPSATELKEAGLKFKPNSNPKHMLDISFEYGVLKIPRLKITDSTKPIFANLIAFEHSKYGKEDSPFTSFVYFLDNLVNTQNDVTILQQCGIVENWLSSEEELTHFLNQVTEGGSLGEYHYLAELNREVNRYIESSWHRHRAKLVRDYFSNPWAIISLVAAFILLGLTCLQSFYAVYAYKFPPSS